MILKTIFALLIATFIIANCAGGQTQKGNQESNKVKATITINGKTENLGYTYARRIKRKLISSKDSEVFALVLTNKPIPEHELSNLLENFKVYEQEQDFSNDKSVNGLLFIISKGLALTTKNNALIKSASYEGRVIKAGRAYSEGRQLFKEFSMSKSVMKGKALNDYSPFSSNAESESALADGKSTKYKYSVEFDATAKGEPINKEAEGAVPPDLTLLLSKQGTAEGFLTVNGITINLKYAYAMRIRQFFDEPEEDIKVLVTDQVVPEDVLHNMFCITCSIEGDSLLKKEKFRGYSWFSLPTTPKVLAQISFTKALMEA